MSNKLNILVIHGYAQTAATVAGNTTRLKEELRDVADLHYAEGPEMAGYSHQPHASRPWWMLEYKGGGEWDGKTTPTHRWEQTMDWWREHLSRHSYDGIIGLSQGSAMTSILLSILNRPDRVPGFDGILPQPIKFAVMCSGFVSNHPGHFIDIPEDLPTLHTVDPHDGVVAAHNTKELFKRCKSAQIKEHHEGHNIPVKGDWPQTIKEFILDAVKRHKTRNLY